MMTVAMAASCLLSWVYWLEDVSVRPWWQGREDTINAGSASPQRTHDAPACGPDTHRDYEVRNGPAGLPGAQQTKSEKDRQTARTESRGPGRLCSFHRTPES